MRRVGGEACPTVWLVRWLAKMGRDPQAPEFAKKDLLTTGPWLCLGKVMLIYRMVFPESPAGTDQKLFLCDLCVSANFAINIPETVSTSAAS
jgi:hypothetical protein